VANERRSGRYILVISLRTCSSEANRRIFESLSKQDTIAMDYYGNIVYQ